MEPRWGSGVIPPVTSEVNERGAPGKVWPQQGQPGCHRTGCRAPRYRSK